MSAHDIAREMIAAYEADAIRHESAGRSQIASVYRAAAHRHRLEMRVPRVVLPSAHAHPEGATPDQSARLAAFACQSTLAI